MDLTKLMELFSNPETITTLSFGGKLTGSIITTVMGMGITFTALVILLFVIDGMHKVLVPPVDKKKEITAAAVSTAPLEEVENNEEEEMAAVMAAILLTIRPGHNKVVIKNIRRVKDFHPRWSQVGLREQIGNRL